MCVSVFFISLSLLKSSVMMMMMMMLFAKSKQINRLRRSFERQNRSDRVRLETKPIYIYREREREICAVMIAMKCKKVSINCK